MIYALAGAAVFFAYLWLCEQRRRVAAETALVRQLKDRYEEQSKRTARVIERHDALMEKVRARYPQRADADGDLVESERNQDDVGGTA